MNSELLKQEFGFLERLDNPPVEERRDSSIQQAIEFCTSMFPTMSQAEIRQAAEEAWKQYVKAHEHENPQKWRPYGYEE